MSHTTAVRGVHAPTAAHAWVTCSGPSKVLSVSSEPCIPHLIARRSRMSQNRYKKYRPAPHSLRMDLENIASLSRSHICASSCNPHLRELMQPMLHAQSCSLAFGAWQRHHQSRPTQPPKGSIQPPHVGARPAVFICRRWRHSSACQNHRDRAAVRSAVRPGP
jgi:hypothetical protein